jgi:hypothetical protein
MLPVKVTAAASAADTIFLNDTERMINASLNKSKP